MGKVALFADIHSNYYAFKACYDDAVSKSTDIFLFLGDYVSDLADTRKTLDLLYEIRKKHKCCFLRGNRERYMIECRNNSVSFQKGSKEGSLLYTYEQLNDADFEFFEELKISDNINLFGVDFEIAHSLKDEDRHYFDKNDMFIHSVFEKMQSDYFLTAHAHRQYILPRNGKTIINPGSIGVPRHHGGRAQYAILNIENGYVQCEFCQIRYNLTALITRKFESEMIKYANCWAVSILYDVITGKEYTMQILDKVLATTENNCSLLYDEDLWRRIAKESGIKFTLQEILEFYKGE